uniref:Bestrophin homolog n=1 Tax=Parascaris equorum TaxID=6256 RepID=A0A914RIX6_PAREQ
MLAACENVFNEITKNLATNVGLDQSSKNFNFQFVEGSCSLLDKSYRSHYFVQSITDIYRIFENIAYYFDTRLDYIPLTFMLGFFVQTIVRRWSVLFENMGYVESPAIYIGGYVYGTDDECRLLRRTMARYLCLTQLLVYRDISVRVRKRFPTYESIVKAARKEGKVPSDSFANKLCDSHEFLIHAEHP